MLRQSRGETMAQQEASNRFGNFPIRSERCLIPASENVIQVKEARSKEEQMMTELPDSDPSVRGKALLQITPGERQALQLIAQGKAVGEVGQCLGVPPNELGVHLTALFAKLGAGNGAEAIAEAARRGIVDT
jgi:DNA-binding CsgD family transcriptional regulator